MDREDISSNLEKEEAGSYFISTLENVKTACVNEKKLYNKYISVDELYRKLIANLDNTPEYVSGLFVLRSHSSFLSAGYLAFSGQLADSFALQRSVIEAALYGHYMKTDTEKAEVWLRRNEEGGKQKSRNLFTYGKVIKNLKKQDSGTASIIDKLYSETIDFGAHPNMASIMSNVSIVEEEHESSFKLNYFNVGNIQHQFCMKRVSQVGLACLDLFSNIWKERYVLIGLDSDLEKIKRGL